MPPHTAKAPRSKRPGGLAVEMRTTTDARRPTQPPGHEPGQRTPQAGPSSLCDSRPVTATPLPVAPTFSPRRSCRASATSCEPLRIDSSPSMARLPRPLRSSSCDPNNPCLHLPKGARKRNSQFSFSTFVTQVYPPFSRSGIRKSTGLWKKSVEESTSREARLSLRASSVRAARYPQFHRWGQAKGPSK
jgi:hypothetical protein